MSERIIELEEFTDKFKEEIFLYIAQIKYKNHK